MISFDEYQERTGETAIYPGQGSTAGLTYCALGLGESGEVQGKVKKVLRDDGGHVTPEKREAIAKELGDMLWYVSQTASEINMSLGDIATGNLAKLAGRKDRGTLQGSGDDR